MHRNIAIFKWFNFFTDFKFFASIAILYFAQVSGSFTLGMSVFSLTMLSSALLEIPTGIFSDRIGRKYTVVLGAIAASLAVLLYALANSFLFLAAGAILEGLSRALYSGNNDALVHDSLRSEHKEELFGEILGKLSSYFQIALACSAIIGAILAVLSFRTVVWLSIIPQLLCISLAMRLTEVYKNQSHTGNIYNHLKEAIVLFWKNPKLRLLSISDMLNHSFSESSYLFSSAFTQTVWPVWAIGIAKAGANIGAAIGFHYSGKILKRFNPFQILMVGYMFRRGITILGAMFPTIFSPVIMMATSVPWAISFTAQNSLLQKEFVSSKRATMASLNSFGGNILFALLAVGIGLMGDMFSPATALIILQSVSLINLVFYWRLFHRHS